MRILLAEDDPNISIIARLTLEKVGGHDVEVASNGEMALEMALKGTYDVILLDEMMPKLNGVKVCQEYRAHAGGHTPVIFLSAKSQDADIKEFFEYGNGFIPKPFDPMTLSRQIDDILSGRAPSEAS